MFLRKISKVLLLVVWIALLVAELIYFVPCKKNMMRLSDDGTSHLNTIGNSYASIFEIEKSYEVNEENGRQAYCKTVDTAQVFINVSLTTIVAGVVYFLLIHKKEKNCKNTNKRELLELPHIDFNELAFADKETQEKARQVYAEAMYRYVKSKIK